MDFKSKQELFNGGAHRSCRFSYNKSSFSRTKIQSNIIQITFIVSSILQKLTIIRVVCIMKIWKNAINLRFKDKSMIQFCWNNWLIKFGVSLKTHFRTSEFQHFHQILPYSNFGFNTNNKFLSGVAP